MEMLCLGLLYQINKARLSLVSRFVTPDLLLHYLSPCFDVYRPWHLG